MTSVRFTIWNHIGKAQALPDTGHAFCTASTADIAAAVAVARHLASLLKLEVCMGPRDNGDWAVHANTTKPRHYDVVFGSHLGGGGYTRKGSCRFSVAIEGGSHA